MSAFYTIAEKFGKKMIYRGVDKNGTRFTKKIDWKPSLFVDVIHGEHEGWYNIDGKPVARKTFENPVEFKEFIDNKKYIEDYPIYGQQNFASQFLNEKYPNEIEWDINKIRIYTIDIETTVNEGFPNIREANETISLITLKDSITKKIITFGLGDYVNTRPDVKYIKCQSEIVLLSKFIELWRNEPPDIVTGWNIEFFDIPYLVNRITRILGEDRARQLSPYGFLIQKFEKWSKHSSTTNEKYKIYGISQLDYMAIYKTHTYTNKAMYSLDFICNDELGEQKLTHEYKNFKEFYEKDWQRFTDYNIRDVELVDKLEDKLSLLQIHLSLSYTSKVNFEDGFKGTRRWDNIIHNYLYAKKITIPPIDYNIEKERYEGAYVKAPITGAHDWVCSFDASSLYPSIMQALNISPEKLIGVNSAIDVEKFLSDDDIDNPDNHCISPSGAMFKKDSLGHIPEIIKMFMDKRVEVKNKMLEAEQALEELGPNGDKEEINKWATVKSSNFNKQMAVKISLNSLYGALGYSGFRLYSLELSKAVTLTGQFIIRYVDLILNKKLNDIFNTTDYNYCFYLDTDSVYIRVGEVIKKFMPEEKDKKKIAEGVNKLCKERIQPLIDNICVDIHERLNTMQDKIVFKQECIADRGLWTAKKKYILNMYSNEGVIYDTPKKKIMGLEMIQASTPQLVRDKLNKGVDIILHGTEEDLKKFILDYKAEFNTYSVIDIAISKNVSYIDKYRVGVDGFEKGTPINSRSSIIYNNTIKSMNLEKDYELIREKDKIKYVYLKEPNPVNSYVIAMLDEFPPEFELEEYIDRNLQFQKVFANPLENIIKEIGWTTQDTGSSMLDFFGL